MSLPNVSVGGRPLPLVPLLPRCGCFLRGHRGQLPATLSSMLAGTAPLQTLANLETLASASASTSPKGAVPSLPPSDGIDDQRPAHSVDQLPTRELMVYRARRCEEELLGTVVVSKEHKLSDVALMLRDQLGVHPAGDALYRGTTGKALRVPINKRQLKRPALPFFPSESHYVVVEVSEA